MRRHRQSRWDLLLVASLAARLLLPPGVMPGRSASGAAALVVCSGHQADSGMQSHDGPKPVSDPSHEHALCPFAAAGAPAPVPVWGALAAQAMVPTPRVALPEVRGNARSGPLRSQSSRAPPA